MGGETVDVRATLGAEAAFGRRQLSDVLHRFGICTFVRPTGDRVEVAARLKTTVHGRTEGLGIAVDGSGFDHPHRS